MAIDADPAECPVPDDRSHKAGFLQRIEEWEFLHGSAYLMQFEEWKPRLRGHGGAALKRSDHYVVALQVGERDPRSQVG